jgi:hypothetical protein
MHDVAGRDANGGLLRPDVPLHTFAGANTFIPAVLPFHPAFGAEVDPALLAQGIDNATTMLRRAATVSAQISGGSLVVRVTNETGHKLPTGYPEGRRMWLHVRAFDASRAVVFESGRYVFGTATLSGYDAAPLDPDYDPFLHVWESHMGVSADVALATGLPQGRTNHLVLNNVRLKDNRIPPRGFTNAAFEAIDAEPVGAAYPDGQYWDEVSYPVGSGAVAAEVTLYYQTASREYVEFLRDTNVTTAAGNILYGLWADHNESVPVALAVTYVDTDRPTVTRCQRTIAKLQSKYLKRYLKEWGRCDRVETSGLTCDTAGRDARIAAEAAKLRLRVGGSRDVTCAGRSLTPSSIGHGSVCAAPCASIVLFDMTDVASCALCLGDALGNAAIAAAYGPAPPAVPATVAPSARQCQQLLGSAAEGLARGWSTALAKCEHGNATGHNVPPADCATDPDGLIARAQQTAAAHVGRCGGFAGIAGCATGGTAPAVTACIEAAVGGTVGAYTEVAYP